MAAKKKPRCLKWARKKTKGKRRCVRRATGLRGSALGAAFSRKHYQAVADILCASKAPARLTNAFSDYFASENPDFKPTYFKKAAKSC